MTPVKIYTCEVKAKHLHKVGKEMSVDPDVWSDSLFYLVDYWSVELPFSRDGAFKLYSMLQEKNIPARVTLTITTFEVIHGGD